MRAPSLLLDENLSPRLIERLHDVYPGSRHVSHAGLASSSDLEIRSYARKHGLIVLTKDSDFVDMALLLGVPPKVVWLRLGNVSTAAIEKALRDAAPVLGRFGMNPDSTVIEVR